MKKTELEKQNLELKNELKKASADIDYLNRENESLKEIASSSKISLNIEVDRIKKRYATKDVLIKSLMDYVNAEQGLSNDQWNKKSKHKNNLLLPCN